MDLPGRSYVLLSTTAASSRPCRRRGAAAPTGWDRTRRGAGSRQVLRRPKAARLLAPTLIARIPDAIAATAIVVLVRSVTGSYSAAGLAAGAFGIGTAVSAPLAGRALDRLGQRRVLPPLTAGFAAALVVLALGSRHLGVGPITAVAAAAGLTRPPIEAALRALWPRLVPRAEIDAAYALDSTVQVTFRRTAAQPIGTTTRLRITFRLTWPDML